MKKSHVLILAFLFFGYKLNAQTYAPDTTFKFSNPKLEIEGKSIEVIPRAVHALSNAEYWVGFINSKDIFSAVSPFYFVKYNSDKEVFRITIPAENIYLLGNNEIVLQAKNGDKIKVDTKNKLTYLNNIDGKIIYIDTLRKHIYTKNNLSLVRYNYNETLDQTFNWEGGNVYTNIIVLENGKIHHADKRFNNDGTFNKKFKGLKYVMNPNDTSGIYYGNIHLQG